ncbi:PC4/YdbC family ssDNA-binding protein [Marinilactibacillus sp. XAAS-LB27]|uniref:YdbC family protein n=1 Tax=unclassified Marinilactibacillus TaxID=2632303 RepID=UPI001CE492E3|nr:MULTISPECIES: PC4/YdbC family ssDNA-binding protein [unclassified Marinilactibacillus]MEC6748389.1 PC4/YdbC family ssDNA-binding protein [Marinilactibacillus sp. XAAS-LB27]
MAGIEFEIMEHIGTISEGKSGWKKELNLVSWNGNDPKFDIRDWSPDYSKMGKGLTLSAEDLTSLKKVLDKMEL